MRYVSTRGAAPELGFADAMLAGLARDGGLYVPAEVPALDAATIGSFAGAPYEEVAATVMAPFVGDAMTARELRESLGSALADFAHPAKAPLAQFAPGLFGLELFHGPTLAFKDFAMTWLARAMDGELARRRRRATVVGATSGDTGSAAISAFAGRDNVDVFVLFPHGRVSDVQRRQMTTSGAANAHAIAVDGDFDDCQALVKGLFNDHAFRDRHSLAGVNSINWARILAQVVYYFVAGAALGAPRRAVSFAVPTGNFGDVLAGAYARRMGLPVGRLVVATNENDVLARTLATGACERRETRPTMSPSMDIQVSSNFERALFDACGRDPAVLRARMDSLAATRRFDLSEGELAALRRDYRAVRVGEDECLDEMARVRARTGHLLDPHGAIASRAARALAAEDPRTPAVALLTAHPAKFPDAVERATGVRPALPARLAGLMERRETFERLPGDLAALRAFVAARARAGAAASAA